MSDDRSVTLRFLSQEATIESGVTNMSKCVETISDTFDLHARGRTLMGGDGSLTHGQILKWPTESPDPQMPPGGPDRRFAAMPAYVGGDVYKVGVKWYGSNINNPRKNGLPRSIHLITLNDPDTGKPVAMLDGTLVSAMRTGAVAGVGAHQIAGDAETAAVIGAGVIGRTATMALDAAVDTLQEVKVFDLDDKKSIRLSDELTEDLDVVVRSAESTEKTVSGADVVVVAAAGRTPPTLDIEWLKEGTTVIPLGDVDLPVSAIANDGVYVDDRDNVSEFVEYADWQVTSDIASAVESGRWSFDEFTELSALVSGDTMAPSSGTSILLAYGLPIEDVAWSTAVYRQAVEREIGEKLTLFEDPHWI